MEKSKRINDEQLVEELRLVVLETITDRWSETKFQDLVPKIETLGEKHDNNRRLAEFIDKLFPFAFVPAIGAFCATLLSQNPDTVPVTLAAWGVIGAMAARYEQIDETYQNKIESERDEILEELGLADIIGVNDVWRGEAFEAVLDAIDYIQQEQSTDLESEERLSDDHPAKPSHTFDENRELLISADN